VVHAWPLSGRTEDTERLDGQLAKLGVAIGDALLIGWGDYHHLLAVRQVRVATLASAAALSTTVAAFIDASYRRKLGDDDVAARGCHAHRVQAAQCGIRGLATALGAWSDDDTRRAQLASLAIEGRARQRVRPTSPGHVRGPSASDPASAELAGIYERAWRLFEALPATGGAWREEREAVMPRWLEMVHG
jgi:hypothetical protein